MPAYYRCYNPDCSPSDLADGFDFSAVEAKCPKCHQGRPVVVDKTAVHLLISDKEKGNVRGYMGSRWRCLCDKEKTSFTAPAEAATNNRGAVSCPKCLDLSQAEWDEALRLENKKQQEAIDKRTAELAAWRLAHPEGCLCPECFNEEDYRYE